jgi:hypothetical protein
LASWESRIRQVWPTLSCLRQCNVRLSLSHPKQTIKPTSRNLRRGTSWKVISRHACPKKIISDRGAEPFSDRLKNLYTTAYHPQTSARCERANSWVERCISVFIRESGLAWERPRTHSTNRCAVRIPQAWGSGCLQYRLKVAKRLRESYDIALRNQIEADTRTKTPYDAKQKMSLSAWRSNYSVCTS